MSLLLKCLLGAFTVLLIVLLSKTKSFFIATLVPLAPIFAVITHYIIATERTQEDLKVTALFGMYALIPYFIYLFAVYWFSTRYSLSVTLLGASMLWIVSASLLLLSWQKLY